MEAFRAISDHAAPKNVPIALESVTVLQTNFILELLQVQNVEALFRQLFFKG